MLEYPENRDFTRVCVECEAQIRVHGDIQTTHALVKDLSASGLLLVAGRELTPGTSVAVSIRPSNPVTPPLNAQVQVLRCYPLEDAAGQFAAACSITEILAAEEAGESFP